MLCSENTFNHCVPVKSSSVPVFVHHILQYYIKLYLYFLGDSFFFFFLLATEHREEQGQRESHKPEWRRVGDAADGGTSRLALVIWGSRLFTFISDTADCLAVPEAMSSTLWVEGERKIVTL